MPTLNWIGKEAF